MKNPVWALSISEKNEIKVLRIAPELKNIYNALGCDTIEGVFITDGVMYIDEEGKLKDRPQINSLATAIARTYGNLNDWIAGNAIIFGTVSPDGEYDGNDYDFPEYLMSIVDASKERACYGT